ncbi:MAG TPA: hypothetical protein VGE45_20115 [Chloroflexia bacterium]
MSNATTPDDIGEQLPSLTCIPNNARFPQLWEMSGEFRDVERLRANISDTEANKRLARYIERAIRNEFILLFFLMSVALAAVFFAYFTVLFNLLLNDSLLRQWIGNTYLLPRSVVFDQEIYSVTSGPVAQVTTFFAIITAGIGNVQIVADEERRKDIVDLYSKRAKSWMAMSALLRAVNKELSN